MNWGSGQKLRLNEARSNTLEKKVQKNKGLDKLYNSLRGVARHESGAKSQVKNGEKS